MHYILKLGISIDTDEHQLTCKILPGREGLPVIDGALEHPQIRPWRVGKLHDDVSDMEKLGRKQKHRSQGCSVRMIIFYNHQSHHCVSLNIIKAVMGSLSLSVSTKLDRRRSVNVMSWSI